MFKDVDNANSVSKDMPQLPRECFESYKDAVLLIQSYIKELVAFHKNYYQDYCQYKHGMAVLLRKSSACENLLKGTLWTYNSYNIGTRMKQTAIFMELFPETQPYVKALHEEKNLLYSTLHVVNLDNVFKITEEAYVLLTY